MSNEELIEEYLEKRRKELARENKSNLEETLREEEMKIRDTLENGLDIWREWDSLVPPGMDSFQDYFYPIGNIDVDLVRDEEKGFCFKSKDEEEDLYSLEVYLK